MKAQPPSDVLGGCAFKIREIFFTIYILFLNEFCLMCRLYLYFFVYHPT